MTESRAISLAISVICCLPIGLPVGIAEGGETEPAAPATNGDEPDNKNDGQDAKTSILTSRQPIGRVPDDAFITRGTFDRSIALPDGLGSFRIGGNIILNANYDFENFGFQQISVQPSIPVDGSPEASEQQFAAHVRFSRFNFDYRNDTPLGEFRTFIEMDFFGDGNEVSNNYAPRLRHVAGELGNWKFGQFWSGFMDVFSQPETADPGGPLALPSLRQPGIYYVGGDRDGSGWGIGIENPAADLSGNTDLQRSEFMPTFVAFAKIQGSWGYVRLAGIALQFRSTEEDVYSGGAHLSGRINLPFLGERDNISFGAQYGQGFVHFYESFIGGRDGFIDDEGNVDLTTVMGAFGALQYWWSDRWRSTVNFSYLDLDLASGFAPLAYANGYRISGNLVVTPILGATFGFEMNYDRSRTKDDSVRDGLRLEFVSRLDF